MSESAVLRVGHMEEQLGRVLDKLDAMDLRARDFELSTRECLVELRTVVQNVKSMIDDAHRRTSVVEARIHAVEDRLEELDALALPKHRHAVAVGAGVGGSGILLAIVELVRGLLS